MINQGWRKKASIVDVAKMPGKFRFTVRIPMVSDGGENWLVIATQWDDVAKHAFYAEARPHEPGLIHKGDSYTALYSFTRKKEALRFQKKFGGSFGEIPL